ncbi:MAG: NAD(P)-binding domain-containing protein [Prochloraceae cyanobacterium]|nr:NAD(P)-binding domain-containing protein [Prochloraceae cyanobacterium]
MVHHSRNYYHDQSDDPFKIYYALQQVIKGQKWWYSLGAKLIEWTVYLIAFLPLPLVLLSSLLILFFEIPIWLKSVLGTFLLYAGIFLVYQFRLFDRQQDPSMQTTSQRQGHRGSVIVIGAGPVGLAVLKECLSEGLNVQCFERQDGVGGVYRFNQDFPGGCWPTVRLTSSPWVTAYSDFPPDSSSDQHQMAQDYLKYLERYVNHFGLKKHLHFRKTVTAVKPNQGGGWCVTTVDRDTGQTAQHDCDRVAICVGLNLNPKSIDLPGLDTFSGEVLHSSQYIGSEGLEGKQIVVVGAGESAVDIANELSEIAATTYLSIRKGKFIVPRINPLNGIANDYDTNRIRNTPPIGLQNWFMSFKRRICFEIGNHTPESALRAQLLEQSCLGPMSQTATKSDDFIQPLLKGKLILRKNLIRFDRNNVIFEDDICHSAEVVVFAHGYVPSFPFIKYPEGLQVRHPANLYLTMFDPDIGDSLAFCGFARPAIGSIPPIGELQARLFAQVAAGKLVLPETEIMTKDIIKERKENAEIFPSQEQPNTIVRWIPYMDKIASFIGCRPDPLRLLSQPRLLWKLCAGPTTGANYRLHGPGSSSTSLETVLKLPRMHQTSEILTYIGIHFWTWPIQIIHPNATWRVSNSIL